MRMYIFSFVFFVISLAFACKPTAPETGLASSQDDTNPEWVILFDGTSVDEWRGLHQDSFPLHGWKVTPEGYLQVGEKDPSMHHPGGDLITRKTFGDFELHLEFMLQDSSNSGVFYLVQDDGQNPLTYYAPEYQVIDNATYASMGYDEFHHTAANYALDAPVQNFTRPIGTWNEVKIIVRNRHVEHWLNGQLAVEYELGSDEWKNKVAKSKFADSPAFGQATEGHIGLQDHDTMVQFRNIKIREF